MSDSYDERAALADIREQAAAEPPPARTTPEAWLGRPDQVQKIGSTVELALQQLAQELAGLRAERDRLRLELEGLRTQLDIMRGQPNDGERFTTSTAEELFAEPGVAIGEPPELVRKRRGWLKKALTRVGAVIAALLVASVL